MAAFKVTEFQGRSSVMSSADDAAATARNLQFATYLLTSLAAFAFAFALYQLILLGVRYVRELTSTNKDRQASFKHPVRWYALLKRHLIYAPLFRTRHHSEIWLVKGWCIGCIPTRFQSLFIAAVIAMNVALCTVAIDWKQAGSSTMLTDLRNRTGTLAVVNLIPLVITAGRNNPLIIALNLSYDTFNMVHRCFGRIVAAEAIAHMCCYSINKVNHSGGWGALATAFKSGGNPTTGLIALVAFVTILVQTLTVFRRAFYEFFLHFHIALVVLAVVALWYHLREQPQLIYIQVFVGLWVAERAVRVLRLLYRNVGSSDTTVIVESLPGDAVKVNMHLARPWTFRPGQYVFITMPQVGLWTSHPFSVAWSSEIDTISVDPEMGIAAAEDLDKTTTTITAETLVGSKPTISAIIRRRDGFTNQLFKKAQNSTHGRFTAKALIEGPYGGQHSLRSYGTLVLFAGGVGITHQIPYVRELLVGHANGTAATRRILLVWVVQTSEALEWVRPWMTEALALEGRRDVLRIQLFITKPRSTQEIRSPSATVQMFPGRPNVDTIVQGECQAQVGAMAVTVCGPGCLADDVRRSVRTRQGVANIDFVEESFSW